MEAFVVALIGGLAGGTAAAILGWLVTLTVQGRQHGHDRSMAQEARTQERRAKAYEVVLEHVSRVEFWVSRTEPLIGPVPEPPQPIADDDLIRINALSFAYASPEARRAAAAF
jgi:hypothetical protein